MCKNGVSEGIEGLNFIPILSSWDVLKRKAGKGWSVELARIDLFDNRPINYNVWHVISSMEAL